MNSSKEEGRPQSDLPHRLQSQNERTETVTQSYEGERFGRIPLRLHDALEMGDLALDEFAILSWLEGRANYNENPPRVIRTLAGIMEAIDWPKSDEALRQKLSKLSYLGLIEYEVLANGKRPYVIYLTGCRVNSNLAAAWRALGGHLVDSTKPEDESLPSNHDEPSEISPSTHQVGDFPIYQRAEEQRAREQESKMQNSEEQRALEHAGDKEVSKVVNNNSSSEGSLKGERVGGAAEASADPQSDWRDAIASAQGLQPADRIVTGERQ